MDKIIKKKIKENDGTENIGQKDPLIKRVQWNMKHLEDTTETLWGDICLDTKGLGANGPKLAYTGLNILLSM